MNSIFKWIIETYKIPGVNMSALKSSFGGSRYLSLNTEVDNI